MPTECCTATVKTVPLRWSSPVAEGFNVVSSFKAPKGSEHDVGSSGDLRRKDVCSPWRGVDGVRYKDVKSCN